MKRSPARQGLKKPLSMAVRVCPVSQCRLLVPAGNLLCRNHWSLVPRDLKARVWDELAKSQRNKQWTAGYAQARRQAIQIAGGEVRSPVKED